MFIYLLSIARPSCAACGSFLLAHKSPVLRARIPFLALVVPNHRRNIQPDDCVGGTVLLSRDFAREFIQAERGERERKAQQ